MTWSFQVDIALVSTLLCCHERAAEMFFFYSKIVPLFSCDNKDMEKDMAMAHQQ